MKIPKNNNLGQPDQPFNPNNMNQQGYPPQHNN